MPRTPLSHSRIELFEQCPLKFKALTFDKLKGPRPIYFDTGSFFHAFAEEYVKHLCKTSQYNDHAYASQLFDRLWKDRHEVKDYSAIPESLHDEMYELCEGFWTNRVFDPNTILEPELEVALTEQWTETTWMAKDVFFRAKIDLPEILDATHARITDYKSGYGAWSMDDAQHHPQLKRYVAVMLALNPEIEEFEVCVDFVRPNIVRRVRHLAEAGLQERERIIAVSDRVEATIAGGKWEATPGAGCADCPLFATACPAKTMAAPLRGVNSEAEAVQAFQKLVMLDQESKMLKAHLKVWTDGQGPVVSGGQQYGPQPVNSPSYDVAALLAWAEGHGIPGNSVIKSVGQDDLDKAIRKRFTDKGERDNAFKKLPTPTMRSYVDYRVRKISAGEE